MKKPVILFLVLLSHFTIPHHSHAGETPKRIISLAPSITEILFAIGLGDHIVGVTSFCDYPEEAKKKPKIGGMSNPSLEAVISLKPDVVVMTTDGNPKEFEERLRSLNIKTYISTTRRLPELPRGIRDMGLAFGVKARADAIAQEIEEAITKFRIQNQESEFLKRKVLFIVWPEPLIAAGPGTVIDDALSLFGLESIASKAVAPYPKYSIEAIVHQAPDMIFIGRGMGADMKEATRGLLERISMVPAVKKGRIFYLSDNLYRLAPRITKGLEELARCLKQK